ncbi:hypothetical protein DdX_21837 [Ditylenchus destructor]|uniref:Uncharacterized protein n=1 Tax=Ditylenchus destructor TaxID=166010 RepID=A0AAD4MF40_9BILA|nr:hypothetical protein DdX_21837 [Ditylenchus destructor]
MQPGEASDHQRAQQRAQTGRTPCGDPGVRAAGAEAGLPPSSASPNTHGLIAPAPKPITERTENATPSRGGATTSASAVE